MRTFVHSLGTAVVFAAAAAAQGDLFEHVPLRVSSVRPNGEVVVDRGRRDNVRPGDRVLLQTRAGQTVQGTVKEVEDRTALVELIDRTIVLPAGSRGEVLVPRARKPQQAQPPTPAEPQPQQPEPQQPSTDPGRTNKRTGDEDWKPGMPLLGGTRPSRPEERASRITGRVFSAVDVTSTLDTFTHSYARLGTDFVVENAFGDGGVLRFDGEAIYLTETDSQTGADLRVYELSYTIGGTRFSPTRWTFGRFLHTDMPELGILDGVEVGRRTEGGNRLGASFGYLPELDEDMDSLTDLQVAAWYVWNDTDAERVSYAVGYQKSWHHLEADRDLVVARARYLPLEGWDYAISVWVDYYTGGDTKRSGPEITRARAHTSRRWKGSGGLEFGYDHEEYPDVERQELRQTLQLQTILDAHQDRLWMHAYSETDGGSRYYTRLTGWVDEEREGGAAEIGLEAAGLFGDGTRTRLAAFDVQGLNNNVLGGRVTHGCGCAGGRLDALGEVGFVHHEGFPNDRDDLLQYRLGGLWTSDLGGSWDVTLYGDGTLYDEEFSFSLGLQLQTLF
jgi:hypothetical protein